MRPFVGKAGQLLTKMIAAMGQSLVGHIDVGETQVVLSIDLPPALAFVQPIVEGAIRQQGQKLLAPPSG